jgi:hypothetical protein
MAFNYKEGKFMLAFLVALGLLIASATVLPAVIGEITFSAISLIAGGMLIYMANYSSQAEFPRGIVGLASAVITIGVANAF